jgi:subtilisin family serine protease
MKRAKVSFPRAIIATAAVVTVLGAGLSVHTGLASARATQATLLQTDPVLAAALAAAPPNSQLTYLVRIRDKADMTRARTGTRQQRQRDVVTELHAKADTTQALLKPALDAFVTQRKITKVQPLWVINAVSITATPEVLIAMANRPEIESMTPDAINIVVQSASSTQSTMSAVVAGTAAMWDLGYTGQGVVVADLDTGVDVTHPDLAGKWRGGTNSWFDPYGQHLTVPTDFSGHGTATTGAMIGGGASGTVLGNAPDAKWIAARVFDDAGRATATKIHLALQWTLDPDGNPATADAPSVVNNSWSFGNPGCNLEFQPDLQAMRSAGIVPVFAAGNTGPYASSSVSPANYPEAIAVGVTDTSDVIDSMSANGPTTCRGTSTTYPDLVAPGVNIVSTDLYGTYGTWTGTSMSAPSVSGAIAVLMGTPAANTADVQAAVLATAVDLGAVGPDNIYGRGRINTYGAYLQLQQQGAATTTTPAPTTTTLAPTTTTTTTTLPPHTTTTTTTTLPPDTTTTSTTTTTTSTTTTVAPTTTTTTLPPDTTTTTLPPDTTTTLPPDTTTTTVPPTTTTTLPPDTTTTTVPPTTTTTVPPTTTTTLPPDTTTTTVPPTTTTTVPPTTTTVPPTTTTVPPTTTTLPPADKTGPVGSGLMTSLAVTNGATPMHVGATFTDALNKVAAAEWRIDTGTATAFVPSDGFFDTLTEAVAVDIPSAKLTALSNGNHTIGVRAKDAVGNWGAYVLSTVLIDKQAPTTAISSPTANFATNVVGGTLTSFTVAATATEPGTLPSGVVAMEWYQTPAPAVGTGTAMTVSGGAGSAVIDFDALGWAQGSHTIYVRSKDAAGNWSSAVSRAVNIVSPNLFFNGFDAGTLATTWSAVGGTAGRASVVSGSAQAGGSRLDVAVSGGTSGYVQDNTPNTDALYRARFWVNPNGLTTGAGAVAAADGFGSAANPRVVTLFRALSGDGAGTTVFEVQYRRSTTTGYQVRLVALGSTGLVTGGWRIIANGAYNSIEVDWQSSATATPSLAISGTIPVALPAMDTTANAVGSVQLGVLPVAGGVLTNITSGAMRFDSFFSTKGTTIR